MVAHTVRPGYDAGHLRVGALRLRIQVMGRALDQHAPAFVRGLVELVDLEGNPVLGVLDARPQVLISSPMLRVIKLPARGSGE